ncbi:hypothetical protein E2C01_099479 [Portunus trituberculatus]|uniref:Uncharacterized protein n=1 Tax=Portunus trituberculatus TaxID=210409 RepID=A0A5B7KGY7_PORTR|nr:hypothetical protein [Portunus trituberculatus]
MEGENGTNGLVVVVVMVVVVVVAVDLFVYARKEVVI